MTLPTIENPFVNVTAARVLTAVVVLVATWLISRYSAKILASAESRSTRTRFLVKLTEPVLRLLIWTVAMFLVVQLLAPTPETFLAALGSVALAIGFGAQDLVKNFIGGLVILTDRPYQVGDRVKIGEAYGEIIRIGLRSTRLVTPEDTTVTIPNSAVLDSQVHNANFGVPHCQVVTELYIPIGTDPDRAVNIGYEAAFTCPYLYSAKPVMVGIVDGFSDGPYSRLRIRCY